MANPHKGEVELPAGDKILVLRYSIDAICSLEEKTGKSFPALATEMADPGRLTVSLVREILHAGLAELQPEMTLKEAGEVIIAAGGLLVVMGKVGEAFTAAFPKAEAGDKPRPPRGSTKGRTGSAS